MEASFPEPGEVFVDRYRVQCQLGSGGFSRIYHAVQTDLERDVALKILRPVVDESLNHVCREEYLSRVAGRFQQEARIVCRLRSPHTITMYDYGRTEDGLLYMVLEYINGYSLAELLRKEGALDQQRTVKILKQLLASLHEAHVLGMLHRDLKPANIMIYEYLGERDQVKLLDFGIAKLIHDTSCDEVPNWTTDGVIVGTPRYMSPEQIRNDRELHPRSDIYSLGLVAYEMLVGEKAIATNNKLQIIVEQISADCFSLPVDLHVAPELRAVVDRMLQKIAEARFFSTKEILDLLEGLDLEQNMVDLPELEVMSAFEEFLDDAGIVEIDEVDDIESFDDVLAMESVGERRYGALFRVWRMVAGAVLVLISIWMFFQTGCLN